MKIYVGQIEISYCYNPPGRYYNLWFYRHNKCVFTATLFNSEFIVEALHEVGEQLNFGRLQSYKAWNPETHELVIEGVYE